MKQFYTLSFLCLFFLGAAGQDFSITDLVSFTAYPTNKFDALISRKGFKPQGYQSDGPAYYKASKDKTLENIIARQEANNTATIVYQTTSVTEFSELQEELKSNGYFYGETKNKDGASVGLYQKGNVTVHPLVKTEDEKVVYCLFIERKALPKARDIMVAEDLLQLSSHEYLTAVFGPENVKKDLFYFTEKEVNRCSVLFPNTNRQVIFIWDDEVNNRAISFLLIGGHLQTKSTRNINYQIEQNIWNSAQGIYSGMSLKELIALNDQHITLFGWQTEQPGLVLNRVTGKIDFKKIGVVLDCLDCNEDRYYTRNGMINSADLLRNNRRVFVSTFIVLPDK